MDINDFDWKFYISIYDDLNQINTKNDAYTHYINHGIKENRICAKTIYENFDWEFYIEIYDDLKKIKNKMNAFKHYINHGIKENRICDKTVYENFDWEFYVNKNNDLIKYNINDKKKAFIHYINCGKNEFRNNNTYINFDWEFYIKFYNIKNINNKENAIKHYINNKKNIIINDTIYNNYCIFDWRKYISYYKKYYLTNKDLAFNEWYNKGKNEGCYFYEYINDNKNEIKINNKIGIAISVFSNEYTHNARILRSMICLNSIVKNCKNINIIILIDNNIVETHLTFIKELIRDKENIELYINSKNYGIAKTKNICIKLLEKKNVNYICLIDDDIEILKDFSNYIINIFENTDIPVLSNYNNCKKYEKIIINDINFIKTENYYGNFIALNTEFIKKYGYMHIFKYKWGEEHVEFTKRYLINTEYENYAINLDNYIDNDQIIDNINTLHLHSCNVDIDEANSNKIEMLELLKNIQYVDFILNIDDFKSLKI